MFGGATLQSEAYLSLSEGAIAESSNLDLISDMYSLTSVDGDWLEANVWHMSPRIL